MALIQVKDTAALRVLHDRCKETLKAVTMTVVHAEADADDILQDVFVQVWERSHHYCPKAGNAMAWLVTLAKRRAIDFCRRRSAYERNRERISVGTKGDNANTADGYEEVHLSDRRAFIATLLQKLPAPQQEVIILSFLHGMSQRQIAVAIQMPLGTVKTRYDLAMRKLTTQARALALCEKLGVPARAGR